MDESEFTQPNLENIYLIRWMNSSILQDFLPLKLFMQKLTAVMQTEISTKERQKHRKDALHT